MTSRQVPVVIHLEMKPTPSLAAEGSSVPYPATSSAEGVLEPIQPDSALVDEWYRALHLPSVFLRKLDMQGFNSVAFVRWLASSLTGADDAKVYSAEACNEVNLLDPSLPLSGPGDRPVELYVRLVSSRSEFAVPVHPKDVRKGKLTSQPRKGETGQWGKLKAQQQNRLCVRDMGRCQLTDRFAGGSDTMMCHIIPRRRGNDIFDRIQQGRSHWAGPGWKGVDGIDSIANLVTLASRLHTAWDEDDLYLMPFPNVAFDSRQRPLAYAAEGEEQDPDVLFKSAAVPTYMPMPAASRAAPIVRCILASSEVSEELLSQVCSPQEVNPRLRGPFLLTGNYWPPEWLWSYRLASQVATECREPELLEELRRFWSKEGLDPRGSSSETGTSVPEDGDGRTEGDEDSLDPGDHFVLSDDEAERRLQLQRCDKWRRHVASELAQGPQQGVASPDSPVEDKEKAHPPRPPSSSTKSGGKGVPTAEAQLGL